MVLIMPGKSLFSILIYVMMESDISRNDMQYIITKPMDRVFKDGVPRCVTLQKDLKAADIPYVDESGRYADFHALRYTFNTWLQTNGVPPRIGSGVNEAQ